MSVNIPQFKINPAIFREYDIRGIAQGEKDLSPAFAQALGVAYSDLLKKRSGLSENQILKIGVGRDCRLTGDVLTNALIEGLTQRGCDVVDIGVCPTPLTYFSLHHLNLDGSIMVTGSHNASEYNGFKICMGKETIHGDSIQELKKIIEKISSQSYQPKLVQGKRSSYEIIPPYLDYVVDNIKSDLPKLKVVLDAGNGTASNVAPELFARLGAEVIPLYCELDGRFPNHHPDPTVHENLKDLVAKVKSESADFGVAFDGDSDRVGVVDKGGRIIFGDELMILLAREVIANHPRAKIISEVKSSHRLYNDIAKRGGEPIMWKTGHSLIKAKMKETKAALAGEMSGHIFFADRYFGYDDAVYAAARVYEILSTSKKTITEHLSDIEPVVATPEIRVDCIEEKKFQLVEETKKILKNNNLDINDIDGIRVDYSNGWGLIRASNTQPALVLRFEAIDQGVMDSIRKEMEGALSQAASHIGHPAIP